MRARQRTLKRDNEKLVQDHNRLLWHLAEENDAFREQKETLETQLASVDDVVKREMLREEISKLTLSHENQRDKLECDLEASLEYLEELEGQVHQAEDEIDQLHDERRLALEKAADLQSAKEQLKDERDDLKTRLEAVLELWRQELDWRLRRDTERNSTQDYVTPLSTTWALIAWEAYLCRHVSKMPGERETEGGRLFKAINESSILELAPHDHSGHHEIRKARNRWFHDAIAPSQEVLNDLFRYVQHHKLEHPRHRRRWFVG